MRGLILDRVMRFSPPPASVPIELSQPIMQDTSKVLSLEVKLSGREAENSAPRYAEDKTAGALSPLTHTSQWLGA
jgi:hypothetical protein